MNILGILTVKGFETEATHEIPAAAMVLIDSATDNMVRIGECFAVWNDLFGGTFARWLFVIM